MSAVSAGAVVCAVGQRTLIEILCALLPTHDSKFISLSSSLLSPFPLFFPNWYYNLKKKGNDRAVSTYVRPAYKAAKN